MDSVTFMCAIQSITLFFDRQIHLSEYGSVFPHLLAAKGLEFSRARKVGMSPASHTGSTSGTTD
jgi:hypothetical protein